MDGHVILFIVLSWPFYIVNIFVFCFLGYINWGLEVWDQKLNRVFIRLTILCTS